MPGVADNVATFQGRRPVRLAEPWPPTIVLPRSVSTASVDRRVKRGRVGNRNRIGSVEDRGMDHGADQQNADLRLPGDP
jgi:hypothetical protein